MKIINDDGSVSEVDRKPGKVRAEELFGGRFRIEGTVVYEGVPHYMITTRDGYVTKLAQNMVASRMVGRMVWGPVILATKGTDGEMS